MHVEPLRASTAGISPVGGYFASRLITGISAVNGSTATTSDEFEIRHHVDGVSVLGAAYGHGWGDRGTPVRLEVEFQHRIRLDYDSRIYSSPVVGYEVNIQSNALMINGFYDFDLPSNLSAYGGVGVGYSRNVAAVEREVLGTGEAAHWDHATNNLVWSVMTGVFARLTDSLRLEIGYRYTDLGRLDQGTDPEGVTIQADSLVSHDIVVGFTANF